MSSTSGGSGRFLAIVNILWERGLAVAGLWVYVRAAQAVAGTKRISTLLLSAAAIRRSMVTECPS